MTLSAIIASYNHAPYLRDCIESVLNQTLRPDEVIVVDDGSTDGSREIIESFGVSVRAVFQANQGTYATLNAAAGLARGDWIAIQNSDDLWEHEKLERQRALAAAHPEVGLVHTDLVCIDAEGAEFPRPPTVPDFAGPAVCEMLPAMLHTMPVIISSVIVSRAAWERCGPFDPRFRGGGDIDLCLRVSQAYPFGYVREPLVRVRKHRDNAGTNTDRLPARWIDDDWQILCERTLPESARILFERGIAGGIDRHEAALALASLGVIHTRSGEPTLARRALGYAARLEPLRVKTWLRYAASLRSGSRVR